MVYHPYLWDTRSTCVGGEHSNKQGGSKGKQTAPDHIKEIFYHIRPSSTRPNAKHLCPGIPLKNEEVRT